MNEFSEHEYQLPKRGDERAIRAYLHDKYVSKKWFNSEKFDEMNALKSTVSLFSRFFYLANHSALVVLLDPECRGGRKGRIRSS